MLTFSFGRETGPFSEVTSQTLAGPLFPKETRYFPSGLQDNKAILSVQLHYIKEVTCTNFLFPFFGSCKLRVIFQVHDINLKSTSFTDLWASASLRIMSIPGQLKTLNFPSCTAENAESYGILYVNEPRQIWDKKDSAMA